MKPTPHQWIDSERDLAALGERLAAAPELALDTESDGFHHYFDKLCLLQITTAEGHVLVDPLAVKSLEPLRPALEDPRVRVVMHAAEQDLMYLQRDHGIRLQGLFDTSVAAQLTGHTRLGLAALLEAYFDVKMSKANQRDDWSARPLSPAQLNYAVADTAHLLQLARKLEDEVRQMGRSEWVAEECRALEEKPPPESNGNPADISRVKGWQKLPPRGRAILHELLEVRDAEARRRDKPPFRIVGSATLLELAAKPPATVREVTQTKGFPRARAHDLSRLLHAAVQRGQELPESEFPQSTSRRGRRSGPPQRDPRFDDRVSRLREWRQRKSEELKLEPGTVVSQRDLELLAENPPGTDGEAMVREAIRDWRWREFADEWRSLLAEPAAT